MKNNNRIKYLFRNCILVIFTLLVISSNTFAVKKVNSYIITIKNDTVHGQMKLFRTNFVESTISFFNYNIDILFININFKPELEKKFSNFRPEDILEYGFKFEGFSYRFISKKVKSIGKRKVRKKFYLQRTSGEIILFENRVFVDKKIYPEYMYISEYYILMDDNNLLQVYKEDRQQTITNFLVKHLDLDETILSIASKNKTFKDIKEIITLYNEMMEL